MQATPRAEHEPASNRLAVAGRFLVCALVLMVSNNSPTPALRAANTRARAAAERVGASGEWLAKATHHLHETERAPKGEEEGLTLHSAGVTARFTAVGVEIGSWLYAFEKSEGEVAAPRREGPRVTYARAGGITEWYEATEGGIEQGFTVSQRPAVVGGRAGDLVVAGKVKAPTDAHAGEGEVTFGPVRYSQLKAWDATGRALEAAMEWDGATRTLALRISAAALDGAAFPVTIDPLLSTPSWTVDPTDQTGAGFGLSVSGAGDVNGDGFADVLVGADAWDGEATNEGRASLYLGSATGLAATPAWTADPTDQVGASFGLSVSGAGDVNGDGFADVLVGAYGWSGAATNEGRAYLYLGSATGLAATPAWTADPTDQAAANFGYSVSGAGDVNGDGFADVLVGAHGWDGAAANEGRAALYLGSATGLATTPAWTVDPTDQASANFGYSVSGAGDVNGDGFTDVLVGAFGWSGAAADEGRSYLYLGGDVDQPGLSRGLEQFQANGTARIGLGNSAVGTAVVLKERVTQEGPVGAALRLEVEVKPVGAPFDGLGTTMSAPILAGQTASATVSGLGVGAYRWRSRVVYPVKTGQGRWVSYGRNSEGEVDFRVLLAPDGTVCVSAAQCTSSNCVDGVCCNTACGAACDACNLAPLVGTCTDAPAGAAGAPSCAPYVCSGSAATCPTGCFGDAGCATGDVCAGGLCVASPDAGSADAGDPADGGNSDAGSADAGEPVDGGNFDAGRIDGGEAVDAGVVDLLPRDYLVGCGCTTMPSGGLLWALLLVGLARRWSRST